MPGFSNVRKNMQKLLWSLAAGATLVWASATPSAACGATCTPSNMDLGGLDNSIAVFMDTGLTNHTSVSDSWTFTLTGSTPENLEVDESTLNSAKPVKSAIKNLVVELFEVTNSSPVLISTGTLTKPTTHSFQSNTLLASDLVAGGTSYFVTVTGTARTAFPLTYIGGVTATETGVTPTPVPGALVLMAGGLGLFGFAARKKPSVAAS